MVTVSAQEARQRFGELLESARKGERVIVTRRGKPVAELRGVESADDDNWMLTDEEAAKLDRLTAEEEEAGTMRTFSSAEEMVETLRKELKIPKKLFEQMRKKAMKRWFSASVSDSGSRLTPSLTPDKSRCCGLAFRFQPLSLLPSNMLASACGR